MTSLVSRKNSEAYKLDQRTSSISKVPDVSCNTTIVSPSNFNHKANISFHSFRMNAALPPSSTGIKVKKLGSPSNKDQYLQEITNSLPKISSNGFNTAHISTAFIKKSPTSAKHSEYDLEAVSAVKKNMQGSYMSQSQKSFLPFSNKSIPDIQVKLQSEYSPANQIISSRSPAHSLLSTSSPKKTVVEEKLPLKRRALNKDVRDAYRTVINSKEHGNFHDLAQKSLERDSSTPSSPHRNKNKKPLFIDHAKELEKREKEKEEEKLADDIKTKGLGDFRKKIALYNFIRGNYLVEPESETDFKLPAGSTRKMPLPNKTIEKDTKKEILASFGQTFNGHMHSRPHSRESNEVINSRRVDERDQKRWGEEEEEDEEIKRINEQKKAEEGFEAAKAKEIALEQDLKKMQELGSLVSARKTMSDSEQLIFKLVKDGNEEALGYLLARSSELVKAEDNTKQTPLHWAVKRGYYNIVVALCRHGADVYAADITDRKPIDMAERLKKTEILEFLKMVHKKKEHEARF